MSQEDEEVGIGIGKESYIHFYYNHRTHEKAKQSSLLLSQLLEEEVSFTAIPDDKLISPVVLIKTPKEEIPSRYQSFYFNDQEIVKNFKDQCRIMRESALEKETARG